jgi:HAD superfamily hydrolase (TIGR01490 family)
VPGRPAAFFDLDRTLLRGSSAAALAGTFRRHGLIGRRQLVHAAVWQLLFAARGANPDALGAAAERGVAILRGFPVEELRLLVADALEPVLKPRVLADSLALVRTHRDRGERVYLLSATLQEILDAVAAELGFDGAVGSVADVERGVYTGRLARALHAKDEAVRALAAADGIDLAASTAYSDSVADLRFLEAVGNPVAVNPDRALRRIARERGWQVLRAA